MNRAFSRKKDKTWMHTPEALSKHYIPYNAKTSDSKIPVVSTSAMYSNALSREMHSTEVEQPKGTEVVRDAVRKLKDGIPNEGSRNGKGGVSNTGHASSLTVSETKGPPEKKNDLCLSSHKEFSFSQLFARHIKKSEGQKIPKVELQISIYGVKILEPKTKEVQHNCQLHRISFCADDKTDKRIFTFICKDSESNKHLCYVFDSEKCAEEITLTIGQAFNLAYRKFLESGGKDVETRKQIAGLQKRIQDLETENTELKNKVQDLENQLRITQVSTSPLLHKMSDHEQHGFQRCSSSFWRSSDGPSPCLNTSSIAATPVNSTDSRLSLGLLIPPPSKCGLPKPISERSIPRPHAGSVPPKSPSTDIFDMIPFSPISHQSSIPTPNGTQPPPIPSRSTEIKRDLFGAEPFDPFNCGAGDFPPDIQSKLDEMQEGFKMGLTLEGTVFCLDPLDSRC